MTMSHVGQKGDRMDSETGEMYVVDYDLPEGSGRRQFYRYIKRILRECHWKKSSNSVILVDNPRTALAILELARACNAHHANVYQCVLLASGSNL